MIFGHVLVARQDNAGDVLLAGPALRAVAQSARKVTLLCGPRGENVARLLPGSDEVMVAHAAWIDQKPRSVDRTETVRFIDELSRRKIDTAIVLTSFHQSPLPLALLLRLAGVPTVAGISDDYPGSLLSIRHRVDGQLHEVERALSLVGALGYRLPDNDRRQLKIRRPAQESYLPGLQEPYVVVHPGASVPARAWSPDRYVKLVSRLEQAGWRVVVTGGSQERELTAAVASAGRFARDLGGKTNFAELTEVVAKATAVVVGNTGPAHLSAAVGTPVVSIFAPTVPVHRWRPWQVPHVVLHTEVSCSGCRARECPVENHPCIDSLQIDTVVSAVEQLAASPRATEEVPA